MRNQKMPKTLSASLLTGKKADATLIRARKVNKVACEDGE